MVTDLHSVLYVVLVTFLNHTASLREFNKSLFLYLTHLNFTWSKV